jgi:hypothetical protein
MSESVHYDVNRPEVIAEKFDDEYVIVNLKSGAYYGLRGTGAVIWEMAANGATAAEITTGLAEQFDAEPTVLSRAVSDLLLELEQETLIVPQSIPSLNAPNGRTSSPPPAARVPFVAPVLEKHLDMQEVLQLDPIHEVDESGWPSKQIAQQRGA